MFEKIGLSENVIKSKEFSIHNPENNEKSCDFSFEVTRVYHRCKREYCLFFKITSTPVSETVFFGATVAIMDANVTENLKIDKIPLRKYQKGQEFQPYERDVMKFDELEKRDETYLTEDGALNIRCEVIAKLFKIFLHRP
jgi:hypothetical protein